MKWYLWIPLIVLGIAISEGFVMESLRETGNHSHTTPKSLFLSTLPIQMGIMANFLFYFVRGFREGKGR